MPGAVYVMFSKNMETLTASSPFFPSVSFRKTSGLNSLYINISTNINAPYETPCVRV